MQIKVTIEGQKSLSGIQREFSDKLSEKQILKATALALNDTSRRVISRSKKEIKQEYTVSNKYLDRMAKVRKPARGTQSGLYAEIHFSYKPVPMIGFKNKDKGTKKGIRLKAGGVVVEILKGKQQLLKHAFISTMRSGHQGIYGRGSYVNGKFVFSKERTSTKKSRITEYKTASPFTMGRNKEIESRNTEFVKRTLPSRTKALLQQQVDKLTK